MNFNDLILIGFDDWIDWLYSKLDYPTRNSITLLRYKFEYHEKLSIVEVFLLIALMETFIRTYGKTKST